MINIVNIKKNLTQISFILNLLFINTLFVQLNIN